MAMKWDGYDEWKRQMDEAGYYVSDDDLARAAYDQRFANATKENKAGWYSAHAAGDQAGMDKYHAAQESARSAYDYSGGAEGNEYIRTQKNSVPDYLAQAQEAVDAASQAVRDFAPYNDEYKGWIDRQLSAVRDYGQYVSPYATEIAGLKDSILNRPEFSYDPATDPAYSAYQKAYAREGRRASEDALAQAALMTGGVPSSYAQTAAQQAGNYYAAQVADKVPELYKLAYDMYLSEADQQRQNMNMLRGLDSDEYGRYGDTYNRMLSALDAARAVSQDAYGRYSDEFNRNLSKLDAARSVYGDSYGVYQDQRDYADARSDLAYQRDWNEEAREYERGQAELENAVNVYLKTGDDSMLRALGVDPNADNLLEYALASGGRTVPIGGEKDITARGWKDITARVGNHIGLDTDLGQEIAAVPNAIANYLEYWDKMDAETKYLGLIKSGVDISTAQRLCTSGSRWDAYAALSDVQAPENTGDVYAQMAADVYAQMAAAGITSEAEAKRWLQANDYKYTEANDAAKTYMELYGKEDPVTWQDVLAKEIMDAKISTEEDARGFLRKNGINNYNILSKSMWEMERDLRPDSVTATTYKDYLEMMLFEVLRGRR